MAQLTAGLEAAKCKNAACENAAAELRAWAAKEATCWDAGTACQSLPCATDAATGWCTACGFFKTCRTLAEKAP